MFGRFLIVCFFYVHSQDFYIFADGKNIGTMEAQKISKTGRMARTLVGMIEEVTDPELRSQISYYRNKDNKENVKLINENTTMEATEPKKKISKTMQWARAHVGIIEEVRDPELRALLCNYRDKENHNADVEEMQYETVDA